MVHFGGGELASIILGMIGGATVMPLSPRLAPLDFRRQAAFLGASVGIFEEGLGAELRQAAKSGGLYALETELRNATIHLRQLSEGHGGPSSRNF